MLKFKQLLQSIKILSIVTSNNKPFQIVSKLRISCVVCDEITVTWVVFHVHVFMSFILDISHGPCLVMWFPLVCVLCSDWFFGSCVMFSLVTLVICPISHWLVLVMWPALFAISTHHVEWWIEAPLNWNWIMLLLSLVMYWCCNRLSVSLVCSCQVNSGHINSLFALCLDFGLLL